MTWKEGLGWKIGQSALGLQKFKNLPIDLETKVGQVGRLGRLTLGLQTNITENPLVTEFHCEEIL